MDHKYQIPILLGLNQNELQKVNPSSRYRDISYWKQSEVYTRRQHDVQKKQRTCSQEKWVFIFILTQHQCDIRQYTKFLEVSLFHLKMKMTYHPFKFLLSSEILCERYIQAGEWERELQIAPCNHTVFNGKSKPEAVSNIIHGAFIKAGSGWTSGRSFLELLQAYSQVQQ